MEKKPGRAATPTPIPVGESQSGSLTFRVEQPQATYVQCVVCGHKNPANVGLCEMCSNYLFDKKKK